MNRIQRIRQFATGHPDGLMLAVFALLGAAVGAQVIFHVGSVFFYQNITPETVMWACGRGFVHPQELTSPLADFLLLRRSPHFDCSSLNQVSTVGPPGFFFRVQLYLSWCAALLWRWLGVNQTSLWPLAAALAGAYSAGCFALARLFLSRTMAVIGAVILTLSPIAVSIIFVLRDFSKAPFFIWTLVFLLQALRAQTRHAALCYAAAAGVMTGAGYGFRSDGIILVPIGVMFLLAGARQRMPAAALVPACFVGLFLITAYPVFRHSNQGGFGTVVMQGATEPFRAFLEISPAPYSLGSAYSDELTFSGIAAEERRTDSEWDQHEGRPIYSVSQAAAISSRKLVNWVSLFPADFALQAVKSGAWIVGFPALIAPSRSHPDPAYVYRLRLTPSRFLEPLYVALGQPCLPLICGVGLCALLLRVQARSPREAVAVALLLTTMVTYTGIQFSLRHIFHLEFIWVLSLLSLVAAAWDWPVLRPHVRRFIVSLGLVAALTTAAYFTLVVWQQATLRHHIQDLLALPREPIATATTAEIDGRLLLRVPVPGAHQQIIASPADSMTNQIDNVVWSARAEADRLIVTVGGADCPAGDIPLGIVYAKRPGVWQPMDNTLVLPIRARGEQASLVFPAFYRPTQNFESISLPATHRDCSVSLERIAGASRLPMVFSMAFSPGWEGQSLHKGFGSFGNGAPTGGSTLKSR